MSSPNQSRESHRDCSASRHHNIYNFSKLFKKRVGCSPSQYRMRLKIH